MRFEDEIRNALRERAPDERTRSGWALAALDAPFVRRRLRIRPLWPGLAAAAILSAIFWPEGETDPEPPTQIEGEDEAARRLNSTSVKEQRIANTAFLKQAEERKPLQAARKGNWIIVVGGDSLQVAKTLKDGLAWADKLYPEAKHRFLFPISNADVPRGDIIVDRSAIALASAGSWFLGSVGLEAKGLKKLALEVGGRAMTIRIDPDSTAPLILPAGTKFPRFEIPGRMILEDMDRNWRTFRRYYVRVRCDAPKLDRWTEVIGSESADKYAPGHWIAVRLGKHVFHALRRDPHEQAAKEGKPLLVLRYKEGSTAYLHKLFGGVEIEGFTQLAVPQAKQTGLEHYDKQGRLVEILQLPDASAETAGRLKALLQKKGK